MGSTVATDDSYHVDSVADLRNSASEAPPTIVQISDIHGYLESARSALLAVGEVAEFDPIVDPDDQGHLHWTCGDEYVLLFNGDMVDRGPASDECLDLVWRLQSEAPPGHVRYHLGNHEMALLVPDVLHWPHWYVGNQPPSVSRMYYNAICEGRVSVGFEGYEYTYTHAGSNDPIDVSSLNQSLQDAARKLLVAMDENEWARVQQDLVDQYPAVFGTGGTSGRGPGAGVLWLDYQYLSEDAPQQIVGHTRQRKPTRDGNVICGNVLRKNQGSIGGEGVIVETPDDVGVVVRKEDQSASCTFFSEVE